MKKKQRRVRGLIMRTFVTSMIASFAVFSLMVVVFLFSLEDEIFELQVKEAMNRFVAENPAPTESAGALPALDMSYYVGTAEMPAWLLAEIPESGYKGGFEVFGEEHGHFHAYVTTLEDGRALYVLFNARRFIRSTPQIKVFLVFIGGMAALGTLISLFVLARMSRKVSGPLEHMADVLADGGDVGGRLSVPQSAPRELHALAAAIEERDARIQALLARERQFNRDASHELRTPLAVAYGAVELLEEEGKESGPLIRLKTAIRDMRQLTEGILWLGRDPDQGQSCDIDQVCRDSIEAYAHLVKQRKVAILLESETNVSMPVPEAVAHVIVGNILRNALSYTDEGEVKLILIPGQLQIIDTGVGFGQAGAERTGFGIGLSLVERLCSHMNIEFDVSARTEGGTIADLIWQ
ncbi:MAG: HAMP domain-containing histidine kinase [Alphaproteobacteria bacterium]|nr:HAMP domain-containing histidine kinase [Alphaproteobacteria bacterium]